MFDIANYQEARTVQEALTFLAADRQGKLIAGGTDVLIQLRHGHLPQARLIGIRHIEELRQVELTSQGEIVIGSAVTFHQIANHPLIKQYVPVLAEAAETVGGPQIRRVATIGGNICNGATSADSAPVLFALNAVLRLEGSQGMRLVPINRFYHGPGKVDLKPGELLTAILIAPADYVGIGAHYIKYAMRKAMDIATLSCAVACKLSAKGELIDVRLAFGVAAPTPIRCPLAEALVIGKVFTREVAEAFGRSAAAEIQPRTSWRATKEFRLHLAREISMKALTTAYTNGGGMLP